MSGRNWWVSLVCRLCGRPVKVTAGDALFCRGLDISGQPYAIHFDRRRLAERVERALEEARR